MKMRGLNALQSRSHMHSSTSRTTMKETNTSDQRARRKNSRGRKQKDNSTNGRRRKVPSEKNGVRQVLHSRETQHSSRFDLHELDTEARISQSPGCGKNMPKWKPQMHQIPRGRNRSRGSIKWKNGNQKTHRNDCEQSRDGTKTKR